MDQVLSNFMVSVLANVSTQILLPRFKEFFYQIGNRNPALKERMKNAATSHDVEEIFKESLGMVDIHAGHGSIVIDDAIVSALRKVRFDHEHGLVNISGTDIQAPEIVTGGTRTTSGQTILGENTALRSAGTAIEIGSGAQIVITGDASIRQN